MKRFLLLSVALLSGATASAQTAFRIGLRGGGQLASSTVASSSNYTGIYVSYSSNKSVIPAWQAGIAGEVNFGKFALQPAVVFSQKGEKFHTQFTDTGSSPTYIAENTVTSHYHWLEVPLNFVYTTHGDHGLQLFAGPYLAWAVGGHSKATYQNNTSPGVHTTPTHKISYGPDTYNRKADAGLQFGVGYRRGPVQVQLGYSMGLRNLHQDTDEQIETFHTFQADAAYNRVAQLTATYFFKL